MRRKYGSVIWVCMLLLGVTLITNPVGQAAARKITIVHQHYSGHGAAWLEYIQQAAKQFMEDNPNVEIKILSGPDQETSPPSKLAVLVAAGTPPDVTELYPAVGASFQAQKFFIDLRPFIAKDPEVRPEKYTPSSIQAFTWTNGSIWGLPGDIYPVVTFYNRDLIEAAGLLTPGKLGKDWTWNALVELGSKLTRDTNGDGQVDQYGLDCAYSGLWYRGIPVLQAGGRLYDRYIDPAESRWNSPEVEKAFQFMADIYLRYRITLPYWDSRTSQYYLWTGKSAMNIIYGPGIIGPYLSKVDFDWDVFYQPLGPVNNGTSAVPSGWQISSRCKNPDVAWRWIKYLSTNERSVENFMRITGRFPALISAQPKYSKFVRPLPRSWIVFAQCANHPHAFGGYVLPKANLIDPITNSVLMRVFRGEIPVQQGLMEIHRQVTAILQKR